MLEQVPSSLPEASFTYLVVQRAVDRDITVSPVIVNRELREEFAAIDAHPSDQASRDQQCAYLRRCTQQVQCHQYVCLYHKALDNPAQQPVEIRIVLAEMDQEMQVATKQPTNPDRTHHGDQCHQHQRCACSQREQLGLHVLERCAPKRSDRSPLGRAGSSPGFKPQKASEHPCIRAANEWE